jgi:FkbM family methyltransferase
MKNEIINSLIKILPKGVVYRIEKPWREKLNSINISYGQNGEDILINRLFNQKAKGFFVDIGAHHPIRFSNTYSLYQKGWRGINIDAMPGSMRAFQSQRSEDINLEIGVSRKDQVLTFYVFNEPALNTFSREEAEKKDGFRDFKIIDRIEVKTKPLAAILDQHLPPGQSTIDYLNIDAEGLDMEVLNSNNWDKYSPAVISVESGNITSSIEDAEVYGYLKKLDYELVSVLYNTLIFTKNGSGTHSVIRI